MEICKNCIHYNVCGYLEDCVDSTTYCGHFKMKYSKFESEKTRTVFGERYKRKCSNCNDVVMITEDALPYENYCRYCGAKFIKE